MKNYIKIFSVMVMLMLCSAMAFAICDINASTTTNSTNITALNTTDYQYLGIGTDQKFSAFTKFRPTTNFTVTFTDTYTCLNGSYAQLAYYNVSLVNVTNTTGGQLLVSGNYSLNTTTSKLNWALDTAANAAYNNTNITVIYTRVFDRDVDNLVNGYSSICVGCSGLVNTTATDWSQNTGVKMYDSRIGSHNYQLTWTYQSRDCTGTNQCQQTRTTIFAAFALIAIIGLVAAAFAITKIFGGFTSEGLTALVISLLGLAIILFVGYVLVAQVALSTCAVV